MGTIAVFQGWACAHVELNRTRGFQASLSVVEFHAKDFPAGFSFETPEPGSSDPLLDQGNEALARSLLQGTRTGASDGPPLPNPGRLLWQGTLTLGETNGSEERFLTVGPLYVVRVDTVRSSDDGSVSRVRAILSDPRFLFDRGAMRRWSFNRRRGDGTTAADALRADGKPFTLADVAGEIVGSLFGSAGVGRLPSAFQADAGPREFPPFPAGLEALGQFVRETGLADPCLDWDGKVSLYEPGEGRVGYADRGSGPNALDLPDDRMLSKQGTGKGSTLEPGYPADYVRVVGGQRIQTVAVDDCGFVLHLPTGIKPLTDELVRRLTNGVLDIGTLAVWILGERTHQPIPGVAREVTELLASQAWRLARVARVTAPGTASGPQGDPAEVGEVPGPYAHLLPLQERAETVSGRRQPITVESYSFAPLHQAYGSDDKAKERLAVLQDLARLRRSIELDAKAKAKGSGSFVLDQLFPDTPSPWQRRATLASRVPPPPEALVGLFGDANRFTSADDLARGLSQARLLYEISQVNAEEAKNYEDDLLKLETLGGRDEWPAILAMGKAVEEFEREQYARVGVFSGPNSTQEALRTASKPSVDKLRSFLQEKIKEVEAKRFARATAKGADVAGQDGPSGRTQMIHENLPRSVDAGASVYDAELGIVKLSRLPGWLENPGVFQASYSKFVPKPVRIIFGSTVRPRTDAPWGSGPPPPLTGSDGGGETRVPLLPATDQETWWTQVYRRAGNLPVAVDSAELVETPEGPPSGAKIRRRIVTVRRPHFVELIPIEGEGNGGQLARDSFAEAAAAMRRLTLVEDQRLVMARPWPVQCDGVVGGVRITMRAGGRGFETTILTGNRTEELEPFRTRERPRQRHRDPNDGAGREGLR